MAHTTDVNTNIGGLRGGLTQVFTDIKTAFEKRALYNRTYSELQNLNDRELADLGLHRSTITQIARETAYGS